MVNYEDLGYASLNEYLNDFFKTSLTTNHTFDYFVNWEKVYSNVKEHIVEIQILNSLSKFPENEIDEAFLKILKEYPLVVSLLPSILAIRFDKNKGKNVDIIDGIIKSYSFNVNNFVPEEILYFCKKTGLLKLFSNINDLYAYLLGTEVGLDTNARKNRSGKLFEKLIEDLIKEKIENKPEYKLQIQTKVKGIQRTKKADFIITKNGKQFLIFECNFYNGSGSKPIEVANAYVPLQNEIKQQNMIFIWISDGKGWKSMKKTFLEVSPKIEYLINYKILDKKFEKILSLNP
jgi:type II restriction enzyme